MPGKKNQDFKKKKFNTMNWEENEEGYKVCPNRKIFDQYINKFYGEANKNLSTEFGKELKKQRSIWSNQTGHEIHKKRTKKCGNGISDCMYSV